MDELLTVVNRLNRDNEVHGILVQLPLPDGLDAEPVIDLIPPDKDVDGLTERSMGRLVRGRPGLVGCTPLGVMRLLERYDVPTSGKRAVVIGRSTLVGLPLSLVALIAISDWLGRPLRYDPVAAEFPGDDQANRWLDRAHRAPWVL